MIYLVMARAWPETDQAETTLRKPNIILQPTKDRLHWSKLPLADSTLVAATTKQDPSDEKPVV